MNEVKEVMENINKTEKTKYLKEWILRLKEQMHKRYYKKVIKKIDSAGLIYEFRNIPGGYKIIVLYVRAKLKIIENKIFKYNFSQEEKNKQKYQISHCFTYVKSVKKELKELLNIISDNNKDYDNKYYYDINKRNYKIELLDDIIRCHFDYLYIISLFNYKIGNLVEAISYLCLFLNLYKETKLYILSTHTLYKISKSFLLLIKIFIENEDYNNASKYINIGIKVSFQQILFQVQELYYGVYVGGKNELNAKGKDAFLLLKDSRIGRIILNLVLFFLYKGICKENLANIKKAVAFYKQCEWFSKIFIEKNNAIFYRFVLNLKKNAIEVSDLIDFCKEKIQEYEIKFLLKKKEDSNRYKKPRRFSIQKTSFFDNSKFKGLIQKLQGLRIKEIDTVNIFDRTKNIKTSNTTRREGKDKNTFLSNIRLLEAYLRNDFKQIVNNMDKIKLFDFDYKTRAIVQKHIYKLYYDQSQKATQKNKSVLEKQKQSSILVNNYNNEEINNNNLKNANNSFFDSISDLETNRTKKNKVINIRLNKCELSRIHSSKRKYYRNNDNININKNSSILFKKREISPKHNKLFKSTSTPSLLQSAFPQKPLKISFIQPKDIDKKIDKNKTVNLTKRYEKERDKLWHLEVQKSKEFFNLQYLKKRDYIKKLEDRELLFQKLLLKSKKTPIFSIQYFNKIMAHKNADNSFLKIESLVSNRLFNNEWKENIFDEDYREILANNKLEKTLLNSLDSKALYKYKMNKRKIAKREEKKQIMDDFVYKKKCNSIDLKNKSTLNDLNLKLDRIYSSELKRKNEINLHIKEIQKNIYKKFSKNASKINNSSIKCPSNIKILSSKSIWNLSKTSINKSFNYKFL